jgi:TrmH family RNA methyltransferase
MGRVRRMGCLAAYTRGMALGAAITSRSNARVKALRSSFSGKASVPGELLGLEGEHLIAEALRSGVVFETVFVRQGSETVLERSSLAGLAAEDVVVLSAEVFASAVDTASPQGIAAMVEIPRVEVRMNARGPALVLESVRDPGNLGTLLRSAEAFGTPFVLLTGECANPWNPKVVRSSAGSVFRVPIVRSSLGGLRSVFEDKGVRLYAAVVPCEGSQSLLQVRFGESAAIMIGNEGAGLSAEAVAMADVLVSIPCAVESLNAAVAGSTLLYEAMRQRGGV